MSFWKMLPFFKVQPFVGIEPRLQLLPDALVGPVVDVIVGIALEVEALDLRGARAHQGEAALMKGVDQLFR